MKWSMCGTAMVFLLGITVFTQSVPVRNGITASPGEGTIRGRVTVQESDEPIRRAFVRLLQYSSQTPTTTLSPGSNAPPTVATDGQGRFEFRRVPAGIYILEASKPGYVLSQADPGGATAAGRRQVDLAATQLIDDIHLGLLRGGVIVAQVVDDLGQPMERVRVQLMQARGVNGQRQLVPVIGAAFGTLPVTDSTGSLRFSGLLSGDYYLFAESQIPNQPIARLEGGLSLGPTYYPGTAVREDAQRIVVGAAQEVVVTIPLVIGASITTSGAVKQ